MAVTDRYAAEYELCAKPWKGTICPHGIDHTDISMRLFQFCNACSEYVMQSE